MKKVKKGRSGPANVWAEWTKAIACEQRSSQPKYGRKTLFFSYIFRPKTLRPFEIQSFEVPLFYPQRDSFGVHKFYYHKLCLKV